MIEMIIKSVLLLSVFLSFIIGLMLCISTYKDEE